MTRIYLVRHVQAMGNVRRVFQGHTDEPPSPLGEKQLDYLSEFFRDISLDKVYYSPLIRMARTAQAVAKYHDIPLIPEEGVIEIFAGLFENKTWEELFRDYPDEMSHWGPDFQNFRAKGGESFREVYERAVNTMTRLAEENDGKTVAVCTHGGFMRAFMTFVCFGDAEKMSVREFDKNASVGLVEYENGKFNLIFENNRDFLPDELKN